MTELARPEELITLDDAREILREGEIPERLTFVRKHFTGKQAVKLARIIVAVSELPVPDTTTTTEYNVANTADIPRVTALIEPDRA